MRADGRWASGVGRGPSPRAPPARPCRYPGEMGGDAVADVLFGRTAPAGRLPVTVYDTSLTAVRRGALERSPARLRLSLAIARLEEGLGEQGVVGARRRKTRRRRHTRKTRGRRSRDLLIRFFPLC